MTMKNTHHNTKNENIDDKNVNIYININNNDYTYTDNIYFHQVSLKQNNSF